MKKLIFIILPILSIVILVFVQKSQNKKIENTIKKVSLAKTVNYTVKTTLFTKKRDVNFHFTNLDNIIFYNKKFIVTRGGIIQNDFINKYYNATEFKSITAKDDKLVIGYRDGFLLLNNNYINHFIFNEEVKKCVFNKDNLFCIKNNLLIKKEKETFIEYLNLKNKVIDLLSYRDKLYILTDKNLIIKDDYSQKSIDLLGANKTIVLNKELFILSDREIFKLKNSNLVSFKKVSSINNLIFKNNKIYYVSMSGVIYDENLKKVYSLNSLINEIAYVNGNIYVLTPNGAYIWKNKIEKFNIKSLEGSIAENYITNIKKYKNNILVSYFNKGIDLLDNNNIKTFIKELNGVNDLLFYNDLLYVATTNGLYIYEDKGLGNSEDVKEVKYYNKKNGILGSNISKIALYKNSIFIASEGGVSQKKGDLFYSINGLQGLINNRVNYLKKVNNYLYAGTLGGISILDGLRVVKSLNNKNFKSRWITGIVNNGDKIYISTYGGGIYKYYNNEITYILKNKKRLFVNLNTLLNYKNKYLLAGTLKNGLFIYNFEKKEYFFLKDLPSLNITAINVIDDKIFIGSDFGFWDIPVKNVLE